MIVEDQIIVFEVMVCDLDREWWRNCREKLEGVFDQEEIALRAMPMEKI